MPLLQNNLYTTISHAVFPYEITTEFTFVKNFTLWNLFEIRHKNTYPLVKV
jgi:hypothetical protein